MISFLLRKKAGNRGFTIVEVLIAIAVSLIIVGALIEVTFQGLKYIRQVKSWERLQANANLVMDSTAYWVKQASRLETTGSKLEITLPDLSKKTIEKSGSRINFDGTPFTTGDVNVTALTFVPLAHSVRIAFTLQAPDTGRTLSVTTTVARRNDL